MKLKYLKSLETLDGYVIVSVWADTFGKMFPKDLEKTIDEVIGRMQRKTIISLQE
ncbi:hypothetical protein N9S08_00970 [Flavobacteriales bacterium]|nr:hypothetical protein [Flavobacteriales bacterium]